MPTREADLVFVGDGHPLVLVEAKGRPIPPDFRNAVMAQLRALVLQLNNQWTLLVDPEMTQIFRHDDLVNPIAVVPTWQIIQDASPRDFPVIGERTLLTVVERWIHGLSDTSFFLDEYPNLREFVTDVRRSGEWVRDYKIDN